MQEVVVHIRRSRDPNDDVIYRYRISGSFVTSFATNIFIAYATRAVIGSYSTPITSMTNLSPLLVSVLTISPLLPSLLVPIPISWIVQKNGGKNQVLLMAGISLVGMLTVTTLSGYTDITTIDSFDWRFGIMLTSGLLIGVGAGAYQLLIDSLKWIPNSNSIPKFIRLYSFIVGSANVTTPIIIYYSSSLGYYVPFLLCSGLLLSSGLSLLGLFNVSPFNQYKKRFPLERARELALNYGELEPSIGHFDTIPFIQVIKGDLRALWDRRALPLICSLLVALGSSWFTRLILPIVLTRGFGLDQGEAVIASSLSYLGSIIAQASADAMTKKWDNKSGGVKIHLIGSALTIAGSIALTRNVPRWGLYLSLATFSIGYGTTMITPTNIAVAWSKPVNTNLPVNNPAPLLSIFGTFGSLGGILLSFLIGLMVDQGGIEAYQYFFYIILSLMVVATIAIPIVDFQVRDNVPERVFSSRASFFNRVHNLMSNDEPVTPNNEAIQEPEESDSSYLVKFI